MKIIFAKETDPTNLTFGMVEDDQFFVYDNDLWQKVDFDDANMIAKQGGFLCATRGKFDHGTPIDRILPRIEKIEF